MGDMNQGRVALGVAGLAVAAGGLVFAVQGHHAPTTIRPADAPIDEPTTDVTTSLPPWTLPPSDPAVSTTVEGATTTDPSTVTTVRSTTSTARATSTTDARCIRVTTTDRPGVETPTNCTPGGVYSPPTTGH